jgi:hypothetical protein
MFYFASPPDPLSTGEGEVKIRNYIPSSNQFWGGKK